MTLVPYSAKLAISDCACNMMFLVVYFSIFYTYSFKVLIIYIYKSIVYQVNFFFFWQKS